MKHPMNQELTELEQRALNCSAKASSLIRKLATNSPHASLEALEQQVVELQAVRTELADRTGRSALE
jgi:chorismate-pyruvate lyase